VCSPFHFLEGLEKYKPLSIGGGFLTQIPSGKCSFAEKKGYQSLGRLTVLRKEITFDNWIGGCF